MFDIGFLELVVVGVVALLVLGPERMPQAIRTLGLYIGRIRKAVSSVQQEVNDQLQLEEMRQRLAEHEKKVKAGLLDVETGFKDAESNLKQDLDLGLSSGETPATPPPAEPEPTTEAPATGQRPSSSEDKVS